jgi:hypothetical protein
MLTLKRFGVDAFVHVYVTNGCFAFLICLFAYFSALAGECEINAFFRCIKSAV